ncbi:MAG: 4Fe-4S ferredoxin [Actinobacteria bacterium HGW-Actinobacteria-7]|jgi:molybdopterin-containing oxidoreductase family iron-sulfur binding subunit|nr:MAG: 4Fe-4S ferredoxin [Actinobacteria bacterium HGW-Actinobacteria-7]
MSKNKKPARGSTPPAPEKGYTLSRRRFLEGLGGAAGVLAAGTIPAFASTLPNTTESGTESSVAPGGENVLERIIEEDGAINYPGKPVYYADPAGKEKWAMVIDVKACIGCRRCVYACVKENNIGRDSGFTYIQVLEMEPGSVDVESSVLDYGEGGDPDKWYMPVQCMQCAKPTCVYGCPVKATWKEPDGIVVIDYDKCIACRNCMVTCPYFARHFNWTEPSIPANEVNPKVPYKEKAGVVEKCTFCIQRTRNGATTACTEACPVGARKFGDLNDPESDVSILLKTRRVFRFKEELGNEPMIWYVG